MTLNLDQLMARASSDCGGLTDFGDPCFLEPARVLIQAFSDQGGLSQRGVAIWEKRFRDVLKNRLVVEQFYRRYPEIEDETISAPIIIVGLPRTGTTLLQRALGCDERFYPMLAWESRFPAPIVEPGAPGPDPRIDIAVRMTNAMIEANPDLLAIHPLSATEPDEEGVLLEHSFQSFFDSYADIPDYTAWMWENDQTPAYEYLKRLLQFIQWQKRQRGEVADHWVLKTPHHLRQMQTLLQVFPDARIIQTHRDPLKTIPSIASFAFNMWKLGMQDPDPKRAGQQWSAIWARAMKETLQTRGRVGELRFHDIQFSDTLSRPLDVLEGIYRFLRIEFPADTQQRMEGYLEANRREKRPMHEYSLDVYGLSDAQIKRDFAEYRARFVL